jgi:hypothetical protein
MFDFFRRRRERESAIPGASAESITSELEGDGGTVGQPVGQAFPDAGAQSVDVSAFFHANDLGGMLGAIGAAIQQGNFQVIQGESQTIDLQGTGAREEILEAMRSHGIDPDAAAGTQINASSIPELQQQILQALSNHGVDLGSIDGSAIQIDAEGSAGEQPDQRS